MEAIRYEPKYAISDYLTWSGDWELWSGVAVSMSPSPTVEHQRVLTELLVALRMATRESDTCQCLVLAETDWHVDETTVVRPDISVVCRPMDSDFISVPPSLVVEVLSPSTAMKDRTVKRELYRRQGVTTFLIVDPKTQSIEIARSDGSTATAEELEILSLASPTGSGSASPTGSGSASPTGSEGECQIELDLSGVWSK